MSYTKTIKVEQGGWWYDVTIDDKNYKVLLDVPENTKPLKSSEIVCIFDDDDVINFSEELQNEIENLLNESGYLD